MAAADLDLRRDVSALHALLEVRADHLDLGAEGWHACASRADGGGGRGRGRRPVEDAAMKATYGLYPTPELAQRAVDRLRTAGIAEGDIAIISAEPFEEYKFSHYHKVTWMYWIAGVGGAGGLAFGAW